MFHQRNGETKEVIWHYNKASAIAAQIRTVAVKYRSQEVLFPAKGETWLRAAVAVRRCRR
jgi:hypothetical protein